MSDRLASAVAELVAALREELRSDAAGPNGPDRLLSVDEAAVVLGIGRSRLYQELGAGRLPSRKVGRRRLVPSSVLTDYISGRP